MFTPEEKENLVALFIGAITVLIIAYLITLI
jgi:hypothetical protein